MQNEFSWTTTVEIYITDLEWAEMIARVAQGETAQEVIYDYVAGLDDADYYAIDADMKSDLIEYLTSLTKD